MRLNLHGRDMEGAKGDTAHFLGDWGRMGNIKFYTLEVRGVEHPGVKERGFE
jgi:hypothetical protein